MRKPKSTTARRPQQTRGEIIAASPDTSAIDKQLREAGVMEDDTPGSFPVAFCVIATPEDITTDSMRYLMRSLPGNAEVNILINKAGHGSLGEIKVEQTGSLIVRTRLWTYPTGTFRFDDARNLNVEMATKDWVFWLDSDERLAQTQHWGIRNLAETLPPGVGGIFAGQASYTSIESVIAQREPVPNDYINIGQLRMYRRSTGARWFGLCHEQIEHGIRAAGYTTRYTDITVIHSGYVLNREQIGRKLERNMMLLCQQLHEIGLNHDFSQYTLETLSRELSGYLRYRKGS